MDDKCHACEMKRRMENDRERKSIWFIPIEHTCKEIEKKDDSSD